MSSPTSCENRTTEKTDARRLSQPATEIAAAPGDRRRETEQDRGSARRDLSDQASTPVGIGSAGFSDGSSTASSTAVGPGSSTTASAAPS